MQNTAMGARARGARLERMKASPHWRGGRFQNPIPREEPRVFATMRDLLLGRKSAHSFAKAPPPTVRPTFDPTPRGLRVTWLGHATSLVELDGRRFLLDPVWGERISPFSFAGPKRFHPPCLRVDELPRLDAVVISHDHYDHLDHGTIMALAATSVPFVVPLGVGSHLEHWGIAPARITELDWWESHRVGDITVTAAPSRHFSGRLLTGGDLFHSLWGGMALRGPSHAVYFSGDTALFPGMAEIGERLGPFDVVMVEAGSYCAHWRDVHVGPEQAVVASQLLRAKVFLPVHWGTFDMAFHGWTDPIERVLRAAQACDVDVATPRIGQSFEPDVSVPRDRWWPALPWRTAAQDPIVSTELGDALRARVEALCVDRR